MCACDGAMLQISFGPIAAYSVSSMRQSALVSRLCINALAVRGGAPSRAMYSSSSGAESTLSPLVSRSGSAALHGATSMVLPGSISSIVPAVKKIGHAIATGCVRLTHREELYSPHSIKLVFLCSDGA
jgi:hypothetical protein